MSEKVTDLYIVISKKLKFVTNNSLRTCFELFFLIIFIHIVNEQVQGGSDKVVFVSQLFDSDKEDDLVVFVSTPETHKQKLSKKGKNSKSHKHSFLFLFFICFLLLEKKQFKNGR